MIEWISREWSWREANPHVPIPNIRPFQPSVDSYSSMSDQHDKCLHPSSRSPKKWPHLLTTAAVCAEPGVSGCRPCPRYTHHSFPEVWFSPPWSPNCTWKVIQDFSYKSFCEKCCIYFLKISIYFYFLKF